jgi:hypothetical protein
MIPEPKKMQQLLFQIEKQAGGAAFLVFVPKN